MDITGNDYTIDQTNIQRWLYKEYYVNPKDLSKDKVLSSYWKHCSQFFDVQMNDRGEFTALKGMGFGDLATKNIIQKGLNWLCSFSYFVQLSGKAMTFKLVKKSLSICKKMNLHFSYDCFRQMRSFQLILSYLKEYSPEKKRTFLIFGDGYGYLACLIKAVFPAATIILVDIGKTMIFQSFYINKVYPLSKKVGVNRLSHSDEIDFLFCPADRIDELFLSQNIDVAISIGSMHEMAPFIIAKYFTFLRKNLSAENFFYCCNREHKILSGGEVLKIREYPYQEKDIHYVDEYCPWHKYFFSTRPFFYKEGPKVFGFKIPFVNYFDGPLIHRLSKMLTFSQ